MNIHYFFGIIKKKITATPTGEFSFYPEFRIIFINKNTKKKLDDDMCVFLTDFILNK